MTEPQTTRIDSLKAMAAKDPANALTHYMLANEYLKAKQYENALRELGIYFGMTDDEGAGYRMSAMANLALGREDEAKEAYRRGIDAARRHNHPSMASEFESALDDLG